MSAYWLEHSLMRLQIRDDHRDYRDSIPLNPISFFRVCCMLLSAKLHTAVIPSFEHLNLFDDWTTVSVGLRHKLPCCIVPYMPSSGVIYSRINGYPWITCTSHGPRVSLHGPIHSVHVSPNSARRVHLISSPGTVSPEYSVYPWMQEQLMSCLFARLSAALQPTRSVST